MKNMTLHHQILFWADKCDKIGTNRIITEILYRRPSIFFTNQDNTNRDLLSFFTLTTGFFWWRPSPSVNYICWTILHLTFNGQMKRPHQTDGKEFCHCIHLAQRWTRTRCRYTRGSGGSAPHKAMYLSPTIKHEIKLQLCRCSAHTQLWSRCGSKCSRPEYSNQPKSKKENED